METKPHMKIEETNTLLQKDYIVTEIQRWGMFLLSSPIGLFASERHSVHTRARISSSAALSIQSISVPMSFRL